MNTASELNEPKRLAFFERYLTVWVLVCMVVGVGFGRLLPELTASLSKLEFGRGSQVNVPIGVLVEVPVMLSVCQACNRTRGWYEGGSMAPMV